MKKHRPKYPPRSVLPFGARPHLIVTAAYLTSSKV